MNLQNLKFKLPANWREASRSGNENQVIIRVYHLNPLYHADPKIFSDQVISSSENSQVVKIGISTPSGMGGSFDSFAKSMKAFVESGFAPSYMTTEYINDLHKGLSKMPGAEVPDESDMATDITIVQFKDKKDANRALQNYASPTPGLTGPIPGTSGMSFSDILDSDVLKQHFSKEQMEKVKEMSKLMKEKMPEIKQKAKESGINYSSGKAFGYDAILMKLSNPNPPPKQASPVNKNKFQGGGSRGNNVTIPLPKISTPYSTTITFCQALQVNNFVVTGGLLNAAYFLSPGNTPCYSLKRTEQRSDVVEGVKSTYIIPSVSMFAEEGYLCKEDAERALKAVLSELK